MMIKRIGLAAFALIAALFASPQRPAADTLVFTIGAEVVRTTTQSATNSSDTLVSWSSTLRDDASFWAAGSPTKLTAPQSGWYTISATVRWASSTAGQRFMWFKINGAFPSQTPGSSLSAGVGGDYATNASHQVYLSKGDYVELDVFQTSGGSLNVSYAVMSLVRSPGASMDNF